MSIWTLSKDEFQQLVHSCSSFFEIIKRCDARVNGTSYRTLHYRIAKEEIDISHIPFGPNANRERKRNDLKKPISHYLVNNSISDGIKLKKKLLDENLLDNKCSLCDLEPVWNGLPLTLQLDHIDGDYKNNLLNNLRLICPNCHTQTGTFAGRNVKREASNIVKKCITCSNPINKKATRCRKCSHAKMRQERIKFIISKEELTNLSAQYSAYKIAEMFNVGQTVVLRRMKEYSIPSTFRHQ